MVVRRFKIIGQFFLRGEDFSVIFRQVEFFNEAVFSFFREFRQRFFNRVDPGVVNHNRNQVRVGKVSVVMRLFLAAH